MQEHDLTPQQLDHFMDQKKQELYKYVDMECWKIDKHIESQDKVYTIQNSDSHVMVKIVSEMPDDKISTLYEMVQKPEVMQQILGQWPHIEEVQKIDQQTEIFHVTTADFKEIQSREAVICSRVFKEKGNQLVMVRSSINLEKIPEKSGIIRVIGFGGLISTPSIPYSKTHKVILAINLDLKITKEQEKFIIEKIAQKIANAFQELKEKAIKQN